MITANNLHEPSPEFSEYLARDIARALRHEVRFAPSRAAIRARKLSVVMGSTAGSVVLLAIVLVFGTSTGYASAWVENGRQRDETAASTFGASSQLAELQLDLSRARAVLAQLAANKDSVSQASLRAAESELGAMEASAAQIQLDLTPRRDTIAKASPSPSGGISMKTALAVTFTAITLGVQPAPAQQAIQTVTLPPASAKSTLALWSVFGIRQVAGGKLIVNDQVGREVRVFDSTLATSVVTIDSNSYGQRRPRSLSLLRYTGDSSLLADPQARTLRVIDGNGRVARTIPLPEAPFNLAGPSYVDDKGRVLFTARPMWAFDGPGVVSSADSATILRVDLARGRIDTVGRVKSNDGRALRLGAKLRLGDTTVPAPNMPNLWFPFSGQQGPGFLPSRDEWAVLSDGSIALVRGHDYHIDWIRADGTAISSAKLPFDWQRLADENKRFVADSVLRKPVSFARLGDSLRVKRAGADTLALRLADKYLRLTFDVAHLVGSLNGDVSSVIPDLDGNLWILPSAAQIQNGEAVYDIVNGKGELTQRVRVPAGKSIAGFGKGGVVYLSSGDRQNGYYIERTKVPGSK